MTTVPFSRARLLFMLYCIPRAFFFVWVKYKIIQKTNTHTSFFRVSKKKKGKKQKEKKVYVKKCPLLVSFFRPNRRERPRKRKKQITPPTLLYYYTSSSRDDDDDDEKKTTTKMEMKNHAAASGGGGAAAVKQESHQSEAEKKEAAAVYAKIVFGIVAYASCSSMMLIINKLAVTFLPAPSVVLFCQLLTSAVAIKAMHEGGVVESDPLVAEKVKPFMLVAIAFLGALYTNVKTLQYANVETFIVFRSSTPIMIAFLDYVFLGRQLPNPRSWLSLMAILMGAIAYVFTDSNFEVKAYTWVAAWFIVFAFDQVYIKFAVDNVKLTPWGRSYYTNLLAVGPVFVLGLLTREHEILTDFEWSTASIFALSASCVAGVLMSYSQFLLRGLISATSFTVVGTMCKIGTVIINCMIWDKHASMEGLIALFVCIFSGLFYQQSPLRNPIPMHTRN